MVADDEPDMVEILCPWHAEHSDGGEDLAAYFPLGRGDMPTVRGFNCFHDHCAGRKGKALLAYVAEQDGPVLPVREHDPDLYNRYVLDLSNDAVWDVKCGGVPNTYKLKMLKQITSTTEIHRDGKAPLRVSPVDIWTKLPSCVKVIGPAYDASTRDKLIKCEHGTMRINTFYMPQYPPIAIDMTQVNPFIAFMEYLIPDADQRDYFLDWLSCKAQHPDFRGAAMVMVAKAEGTGRGTLMQIIGKLFGRRNVRGITMDDMLNTAWTDWRANLFVHVDESMAMEDPRGARRAYDRLKELIDPMTTEGVVNVKYGGQMWVKMCSSMLLFSNHEDALHVAENTRRFYGVRNPDIPAPPAFFGELRQWMGAFDAPTDWEKHVWAWLLERKVDVTTMTAPPPESEAMKQIKHASKSLIDATIEAAVETWPCDFVPASAIMDVVAYYETQGLPPAWRAIAKAKLGQRLHTLHAVKGRRFQGTRFDNRISIGGKQRVVRSKKPVPAEDVKYAFAERDLAAKVAQEFTSADHRVAINLWLEENEYHF